MIGSRAEESAAVPVVGRSDDPPRGLLPRGLAGRIGLQPGTVGTLSLNVSAVLLNFACVLALSHALGPSGYGAYAFGLAWAMVLAVPAVLGVTPLVVRVMAGYQLRKEWSLMRGLLRRTTQAVATSSAIVCVCAAAVGLVAEQHRPELLRPFLFALILVPLLAFISLRQAAMQGLGRVILGRVPDTVLSPLLLLVLVVSASVVASRDLSASGAMVFTIAAAAVAFVVGGILLHRSLPPELARVEAAFETRAWAKSAAPLLVLSAVLALNSQIGTIVLGLFDGPSSAGIYNVSSRAANLISFLMLVVTYPLMPAIARLWTSGDRVGLQETVSRNARIVFIGSMPIVVALVTFAGPVEHLFGGGFVAGSTALRILAIGEIVNVVTGFAGTILVMTGHESRLAKGAAVGAASTALLMFSLVPPFGVTGAAVAAAAGMVLSNLYLAYYCLRDAGIYAPAFGHR